MIHFPQYNTGHNTRYASGIQNSELLNLELSSRNPESCQQLASEIQVPLGRILDIQYLESGFHCVESRIQDCL